MIDRNGEISNGVSNVIGAPKLEAVIRKYSERADAKHRSAKAVMAGCTVPVARSVIAIVNILASDGVNVRLIPTDVMFLSRKAKRELVPGFIAIPSERVLSSVFRCLYRAKRRRCHP